MAICTNCKESKANRVCALKGGLICPVCCIQIRIGEACPDDCLYLKANKAYQENFEGEHLTSTAWNEFTADFMKVLEDLESVIMEIVRNRDDIEDCDIQKALEYLIPIYGEQKRENNIGEGSLPMKLRALVEAMVSIIDLRREKGLPHTSDEEIEICLKRILGSVLLHGQRTNSRRGYIDFIDRFTI